MIMGIFRNVIKQEARVDTVIMENYQSVVDLAL